jgi:ubiquinone/menaquinone biosynthesis C-methylase UbiE
MRGVLANVSNEIKICDGTASEIPFEDGFFQIVFIAQAFHWFSNSESLREIRRVIKPQAKCKTGKSGLLLIWNMEDREAEAHIAELRDLYEKYDYDVPQYRKNEWKNVFKLNDSLFSDLNTKFVKNDKIYLPVSHIWKRVLSKSYIARLSESEKSILKEKVEQVIEKYKHLQIQMQGSDEKCLHFPYYSEITWCYPL